MKKFTLLILLVTGGVAFGQTNLASQGENNPVIYEQGQRSSMDFTLTNPTDILAEVEAELLQHSLMQNRPEQPGTSTSLEELQTRLANIGPSAGSISDYFTPAELRVLNQQFNVGNMAPMADFIPTAGATETFNPAVGDHFFDPGGPGGSSTGGTPGNYPNCNCITTTTLAGVTEVEFLFFSVFANFDWLKIYDGADTTGTVLYNNGAGGANDGDITLADMIASHGSAIFTGTSGDLTFEFRASAVVDYGGWDAVVNAGGGGGGGTACDESVPWNNMENAGFLGGATNQFLAVDIDVAAGATFEINTVKVNVAGEATTFDLIFYDNAAGLPGTEITTLTNVSITDEVLNGSNFGFNFYTYTLDITGAGINFAGGASGTKYWMEVQSDAVAWESTTASNSGLNGAFKNNNTGGAWLIGTSEYVYELIGLCTGGGGGGGNEWTVNVQDTGWGDEVSWELRDNLGTVILSGGGYGQGYNDTQVVNTENEPLEFYIETFGTFNDNTPDYTVSCSGEVVAQGTMVGGTETTLSGLVCPGGGGPFPEPYCGPLVFNTVEPITLVDVAGISNVTDAAINGTPAHEDFTAIVGEMEQGADYEIALEGNTAGNFTTSFEIYIDWNQNELLDDAGEVYDGGSVTNSTGTDGQQAISTISVPADAVPGETRMRVKKKFLSTNGDPCVPGSSFGQAEDYTINVSESGGGGGDPVAYSIRNSSFELTTFDPANASVVTAIGPSPAPGFENAGDIDPNDTTTGYALDNLGNFYSIDIATGVYTLLGNIPGDWTGMSFDPTDGTLYALSSTGLSSIDINAVTATNIGAHGMPLPISLAINGDGDAFSHDVADDNLYSVNLTTGAATIVGTLGFDANFGQGMTWDSNTDTMYMTAFNNIVFDAEFRSVNTDTGMTTLLAVMEPGSLSQHGWVAIPPTGPPVTNDDCVNATNIECGDSIVGETTTDTNSGGNAAPDEFFKFTGSGSPQIVTISLCGGGTDYDSLLRVFDSCGGTEIATNDDACGLQSEVSFLSDGTNTYYIMVEGFGTNSGNFSLDVTCVDPPVNDGCAGAIDLECGDVVTGTTSNASVDSDVAPTCTTTVTAPGVWYRFDDDSGLAGTITVSLCGGTTYDSKLSVYTGDCTAPPLTCVIGNDDSCGLQSEVTFATDGNTTFLILVHGFGSASGDFTLDITCSPTPPPNDLIVNSIDVDEIGFPYTDPAVAMPAATTEAGNPEGCDITGANGVWYNFVPTGDGTATASITSPSGASSVTFYTAPDETAVETDLSLVVQPSNQCVPGTSAGIDMVAGQAYYVFVLNTDSVTDIVIDIMLANEENTIDGFSFYPNPTSDIINLKSVDAIEAVSLYNVLGQKVIDMNVDSTTSEINVSALHTGTYIMKVTVNGKIGTYKVLKQ